MNILIHRMPVLNKYFSDYKDDEYENDENDDISTVSWLSWLAWYKNKTISIYTSIIKYIRSFAPIKQTITKYE